MKGWTVVGQTTDSSWLHQWPPGVKLLLLLLAGTSLVMVDNLVWLALATGITVSLWVSVVKREALHWLRQSFWLALTIAAVVLYVAFVNTWPQALVVLFRLLALLFGAMAVTASTSVSQMMTVVERVLQPLGRLGWVNPAKVALAFGLSLRLIPVLLQQWQDIREAQAARGLSGQPFALLIPMLAKTMKRADAIGEAIDVRGDL